MVHTHIRRICTSLAFLGIRTDTLGVLIDVELGRKRMGLMWRQHTQILYELARYIVCSTGSQYWRNCMQFSSITVDLSRTCSFCSVRPVKQFMNKDPPPRTPSLRRVRHSGNMPRPPSSTLPPSVHNYQHNTTTRNNSWIPETCTLSPNLEDIVASRFGERDQAVLQKVRRDGCAVVVWASYSSNITDAAAAQGPWTHDEFVR